MSEPHATLVNPGEWLIHPADLAGRVQSCWFDREYWGDAAQPLDAGSGGRSPPLLLPTDPGPSVWRHYQRGGAVAKLLVDRYLWLGLRHSRPWLEFTVLSRLHEAGLRVPRPLVAQLRRTGAWYQGDLLSLWLEDSVTLAKRWRDRDLSEQDWLRVGSAIGAMHAQGCDHADLNAHNLLFDKDGQVWTLDFDRAQFRKSPGPWSNNNLNRLRRSLRKIAGEPSEADWRALLRGYSC